MKAPLTNADMADITSKLREQPPDAQPRLPDARSHVLRGVHGLCLPHPTSPPLTRGWA